MASQNLNRSPLYPNVIQSNPKNTLSSSSHSSLYPKIDMAGLVDKLDKTFPNPTATASNASTAPPESVEELLTVPGAIVHLIDNNYSVELACGDLSIVGIRQGENVVAVLARVADQIQWPLAKDVVVVKLDDSHYFFSLRAPKESGSDSDDDENSDNDLVNYVLTIASKGQQVGLLEELDKVLEHFSSFSVQRLSEKGGKAEVLDGTVAKEVSPADLKSDKKKKEMMEERCAAYWTTLAPNVEDYSGTSAKLVAAGSGKLIRGFCGVGMLLLIG